MRQDALNPKTAPVRLEALAAKFPLEVAQNASAPAGVLAKLAQHKDPEVLRLVAQNPNIPREVAEILCEKFPREIVENPCWQMLLLEDPGFIEKNFRPKAHDFSIMYQYRPVFSRLLRELQLPEAHTWQFARHSNPEIRVCVALYSPHEGPLLALTSDSSFDVLHALVENPDSPASVLAALISSEDATLRRGVALHPNTEPSLLATFWRAGVSAELPSHLPGELTEGSLSALDDEKLAQHKPYGLWVLANDPRTTTSRLRELYVLDDSYQMVELICAHPNADDALLLTAIEGIRSWAKREVVGLEGLSRLNSRNAALRSLSTRALSSKVTEEVWALLQEVFIGEYQRASLAGSSLTNSIFLERFVESKERRVREWLASNSAISAKAIARLAKDRRKEVRINIARRKDIPDTLRELLMKDKITDVKMAAKNPVQPAKEPKQDPRIPEEEVKLDAIAEIAADPKASLSVLRELFDKYEFVYRVCWALAQNPSLPQELLTRLASQHEPLSVVQEGSTQNKPRSPRALVAKNPSAPIALLRSMREERDVYCRLWARYQLLRRGEPI